MRVLVTGADQHQGLAVIRGLGLKGVPVVACGSETRSLGFYSRFTQQRYVYPSQHGDRERFIDAILKILGESGAEMIINSLETTLVVLDGARSEIERRAVLASPDSQTLEVVIDKLRTMELARQVGVPVPRTLHGSTAAEVLAQSDRLRFPVIIKPRGSPLHRSTQHRLDFKVRYANDMKRLSALLEEAEGRGAVPLVQEYVPGVALCVAGVYDRGRPLARFPYMRVRELPITGGVSVLRRSLAPDEGLYAYVDLLLGQLKWHGVAMVEFKYDEQTGAYTLMEINGRFQASTALSLDVSMNLPWMHYALYAGERVEPVEQYRVGVCERYLRYDLMALVEYLFGDTISEAPDAARPRLPSRTALLGRFLWDFRPTVKYDEFKTWDWRPGVVEIGSIVRETYQQVRSIAARRLSRFRATQKAFLREQWLRARLRVIRLFHSYDPAGLEAALRSLGLKEGDTVLMHSSFSVFSGFRGEPREVIDCLLRVIGPTGNLCMMSMAYTGFAYDYLKKDRGVFDVRRTVSRMGLITEAFRRRSGVLRSLNPVHPVLALGPEAAKLVADHERQLHSCGKGSPFAKLYDLKAKILFLDAPFSTCTFLHYLEDLFQAQLPVQVYSDELLEGTVIDARGTELGVKTYVFNPSTAEFRDRVWDALERELSKAGVLVHRKVGNSRLLLVAMADLVAAARGMVERRFPGSPDNGARAGRGCQATR